MLSQYSAMISQYSADIKPIIALIRRIQNEGGRFFRQELQNIVNTPRQPEWYFPEQYSQSDDTPTPDRTVFWSMIGNVSQSIRTAHIAPIGMLGNCDYPKFSKDNTERIRERIDVLIFILEIPMKSQTDTNDRLYEQLESYIKAFMDSNTPLRNCNPDQVRDHMITAFKSVCKFLYDLKQKTLADEKMAQLYADVRHLLQDNATQKDRIVAQETEINRLKANVDFLERKISPGSIEYDYDMIQRRIDPIRDELNYTQRVFARLIRNRYSAPVAILVSTAK